MNAKELNSESRAKQRNVKFLEKYLDHLNDENQNCFLEVLEALNFAQNTNGISAFEQSESVQL